MKMRRHWLVAGVAAGAVARNFLVSIFLVGIFLFGILGPCRRGGLQYGKPFCGVFNPAPAGVIQPAKTNERKAVTCPHKAPKAAHIKKFSHYSPPVRNTSAARRRSVKSARIRKIT